MGKLESGQATPRDKEKLKSVQDALEKQKAEDKEVPGLATAELKARNAALMGKLPGEELEQANAKMLQGLPRLERQQQVT